MSRRWASSLGVAAILVVACTTFEPGEVGVPPEAGSTVEAGAGAGAAGNDAGDGGTPAAVADASPFRCVPDAHLFCDDFDTPPPFARWLEAHTGNEELRIDRTVFRSAPAALVAERAADASAPDLYLRRTIAGPFSRASLQADIMIGAGPVPDVHTVTSMDLVVIKEDSNWHLRLQHSAAKVELVIVRFGGVGGGNYAFNTVMPAWPKGAWRHVALAVSTGATTQAKLVVDGEAVFDKVLVESWPAGTLEISAGAFATYGSGGAWRVHVDNVTLDAERE